MQRILILAFVFLTACYSKPEVRQQHENHLKETTQEKAQVYLMKGLESQQNGNLNVAILYYLMATRLQPDMVEAHYLRGNAHFDRSQNAEAISSYNQVIFYDPDYQNVRFNRALAYLSLEKIPEAIEEFQYVLEKTPHDAEAHKNLGIIYLDYDKNLAKSAFHFKHYLSLNGEDPEVIGWLEAVQRKMEIQQYIDSQEPNPNDK